MIALHLTEKIRHGIAFFSASIMKSTEGKTRGLSKILISQ